MSLWTPTNYSYVLKWLSEKSWIFWHKRKKNSWKRGSAGASSTMATKYLFSAKITSVQAKSSSILAFILLLNFADIVQGKVVFTKKPLFIHNSRFFVGYLTMINYDEECRSWVVSGNFLFWVSLLAAYVFNQVLSVN